MTESSPKFDRLKHEKLDGEYTRVMINDIDLEDGALGAGDVIGSSDVPDRWFFDVRDEGVYEKRLILVCNCGQTDCMSLWATVSIHRDKVRWSNFVGERGEKFTELDFCFDSHEYFQEIDAFLAHG